MKIDQSWKILKWQLDMHQYWFFILNLTRVIRGLIPCLIQHWFPTLRSILNNVTNNTISLYRWRIASNQREGKLVRVIIWNAQFVLIFHAVNSHKEYYAFSAYFPVEEMAVRVSKLGLYSTDHCMCCCLCGTSEFSISETALVFIYHCVSTTEYTDYFNPVRNS